MEKPKGTPVDDFSTSPAVTAGVLPGDTTEDVRRRGEGLARQVAVLPVGSFEQHGACLPLATDTLVACAVAREIAAAYPVHLLPPVTISCSHEHAAWPGTVSISSVTLHAVVRDIAALAAPLRRRGPGGGQRPRRKLRAGQCGPGILRRHGSGWRFSRPRRTGRRRANGPGWSPRC